MRNHLIFSLFVVSILTLGGCTVDPAGGQPSADAETPKSLALGNLGHDSTADMVYVEGGTFQMGGTKYWEKPVHKATVSSFYMSKYEVTQAEWKAVMGTTLSSIAEGNKWGLYGVGDNYPMYYVSWYDAVNYCNKRSKAEKLTPCYYTIDGTNVMCNWKANGYRLPTEAEWEYAARGGIHKSAFEYSGSNDVNEVAWYSGNSDHETHEVGKKKANALGLYDMSGNVWEWCWDWFGRYNKGSETAPLGPASGDSRVMRGGDWGDIADFCRCAFRGSNSPGDGDDYLGFRVVRSCK